ncbi:MAG: hypothetical protein R3C69_18390 [Geminicoccaceae bacterium]
MLISFHQAAVAGSVLGEHGQQGGTVLSLSAERALTLGQRQRQEGTDDRLDAGGEVARQNDITP